MFYVGKSMSVVVFGVSYDEQEKKRPRIDTLEPIFRFIRPPHKDNGKWRWQGLEVRDAGVKGRGVFATETIPPGLLIPYVGAMFKNLEAAVQATHVGLSEEEMDKRDRYFNRIHEYIVDAYPHALACEDDYCIAGIVNEASVQNENDFYNCVYADFTDTDFEQIPEYLQDLTEDELFEYGLFPFILVCTELEPDEELLVYYNVQNENMGYTPKPFNAEQGIFNSKNDEQFRRTYQEYEKYRLEEKLDTWRE